MIVPDERHENDWILALLHRNTADALRILGELIDAGMETGFCSVLNIRTVEKERGLTGAVMKLLKQLGFEHTDLLIPDTREGKRGKVSLWKLVDRHKVETYLEYQLQYFHVILKPNDWMEERGPHQ